MNTLPRPLAPERSELHARAIRIRQLVAAANRHRHELGVLYNLTVDSHLAQRAGHKSAADFFSQQFEELSRSTWGLYGAVARVFSAEQAGQYGMVALRLLMTYAEATGAELNTDNPGPVRLQVPGKNGELREKSFAECTVADLRRALQRLRRPTSSAPLPAATLARAEPCRAAWAAFLPASTGVRVEVRNLRGKPVVSLKGITLEQAERISALLASHRPAPSREDGLGRRAPPEDCAAAGPPRTASLPKCKRYPAPLLRPMAVESREQCSLERKSPFLRRGWRASPWVTVRECRGFWASKVPTFPNSHERGSAPGPRSRPSLSPRTLASPLLINTLLNISGVPPHARSAWRSSARIARGNSSRERCNWA